MPFWSGRLCGPPSVPRQAQRGTHNAGASIFGQQLEVKVKVKVEAFVAAVVGRYSRTGGSLLCVCFLCACFCSRRFLHEYGEPSPPVVLRVERGGLKCCMPFWNLRVTALYIFY